MRYTSLPELLIRTGAHSSACCIALRSGTLCSLNHGSNGRRLARCLPRRTDAQAGAARANTVSSAPFADVAERFNAAARGYLAGATSASTPSEAAGVSATISEKSLPTFNCPGALGWAPRRLRRRLAAFLTERARAGREPRASAALAAHCGRLAAAR